MLNPDLFHAHVPQRPEGRYAHIVLLRETDSYALFQTDGELNTARVAAGTLSNELISRITMFKRKQTTPERLVGRELLRRYGLISPETSEGKKTTDAENRPICDYNVRFCMQCPDCISYGFAIGDSGSEKSKIYSDTAYSLTSYAISHAAFTLNAPYEHGTMSRQGEVSSRINEQDHVLPQVLFPAIITFRDPTQALFTYVLNNILRTRRYGAQTTRTGTMTNHILGIVLADGELCSNLELTQKLFDTLPQTGKTNSLDPINPHEVLTRATALVPQLVADEPISVSQALYGDDLSAALETIKQQTRSESGMDSLLNTAFKDSWTYFDAYIDKSKKKK